MKRTLQAIAMLLAAGTIVTWAALGAHREWTKTKSEVVTLDEVTGLEKRTWEKTFLPGVDFLGAGLIAAGVLAGTSLLFRKKPNQTQLTQTNMKKHIAILFAIVGVAGFVSAAPLTFDFKDPKGVNNAQFKLDAPLEAISGSANGISGTVTFDPANPAATKGKIAVAVESLTVPNPMMNGHLHGDQWMDAAKFKEITFETKELKNVKTDGDKTTADVTGTLTIKSTAKEITAPITLTYLKDKLGQRVPNMKGDLLVVRSNFTIKRSDFGINPGAPADKVSDEIALALSIAGASVR